MSSEMPPPLFFSWQEAGLCKIICSGNHSVTQKSSINLEDKNLNSGKEETWSRTLLLLGQTRIKPQTYIRIKQTCIDRIPEVEYTLSQLKELWRDYKTSYYNDLLSKRSVLLNICTCLQENLISAPNSSGYTVSIELHVIKIRLN